MYMNGCMYFVHKHIYRRLCVHVFQRTTKGSIWEYLGELKETNNDEILLSKIKQKTHEFCLT